MALDTDAKRFSALNIGCPWRGVNYFPTGTVDAAERLALLYLGASISADAPVEVPDVVGETQASGTSTLETALFVVAVQTEYSSSVAAGLIISQDPTAGSFAAEGSTVTITVSLGARASDGGSAKRKHRKRYYVEIDGQYIEVDSQAEAEQKLIQALTLAQEVVAPQAVERSVKRIRRGKQAVAPELPKLSSSPEIAQVVDQYRERINAIYRQIAIDAELRELMRIKLMEQDEEEAIFVLLH